MKNVKIEKINIYELEKNINRVFRNRLDKSDMNRLLKLCFTYNIGYDVLYEVVLEAEKRNKLSIPYIEGIIKNLKKEGVSDMVSYILKK